MPFTCLYTESLNLLNVNHPRTKININVLLYVLCYFCWYVERFPRPVHLIVRRVDFPFNLRRRLTQP